MIVTYATRKLSHCHQKVERSPYWNIYDAQYGAQVTPEQVNFEHSQTFDDCRCGAPTAQTKGALACNKYGIIQLSFN